MQTIATNRIIFDGNNAEIQKDSQLGLQMVLFNFKTHTNLSSNKISDDYWRE